MIANATSSAGRRRLAATVVAVVVAAVLTACGAHRGQASAPLPRGADATLAAFLATSRDLGPTRAPTLTTMVTLRSGARPGRLFSWAAGHGIHVGWRSGDRFAAVSGPPAAMQSAFGVSVHDYRAPDGTRYFATAQQLHVPSALRGVVSGAGELVSYFPRTTAPGTRYEAVPAQGLTPSELRTTYRARSLYDQGYTGKGRTVVFFEWSGWKQSDMNSFASASNLPQFTPTLFNGSFPDTDNETPMDLEVVHAIVPDANLVVVNASAYAQRYKNYALGFARMFQDAAAKYPKSVWSLSISFSCEPALGANEMAPVDSALAAVESKYSITAFSATGDTGGLECKFIRKGGYGAPPTQADVGLSGTGGLPHLTQVGGTLLSTDAQGNWVAEQAWTASVLSQGTAGGSSVLFKRPSWQTAPGLAAQRGSTMRLSPDVSADADPASGVRIVEDGKATLGGGTSQAAPIWAGITTIMNSYLESHGGSTLGNINPLLYRAARIDPKAFHDVTLGGSAVDSAGVGYDEATGLGTPDVEKLVVALGKAQKGTS